MNRVRFSRPCSSCGKENKLNANFCDSCGFALHSPPNSNSAASGKDSQSGEKIEPRDPVARIILIVVLFFIALFLLANSGEGFEAIFKFFRGEPIDPMQY